MQIRSAHGLINNFPESHDSHKGKGSDVMGQKEFLNLLVSQLQNQDPLSPLNNADFMSQTTAFSQLDQSTIMNKNISSLVDLMKKETVKGNSLLSGSNAIGKEVKYNMNTVTIGKNVRPHISFYLEKAASPSKSIVKIYNKAGVLVTSFKPRDLKNGSNSIYWEGKGMGGVTVPDGTYTFKVEAYDDQGKAVAVREFGVGTVKGVKMVGGKLYYDTGSGTVSSEYVYSMRNPSSKGDMNSSQGNYKAKDMMADNLLKKYKA